MARNKKTTDFFKVLQEKQYSGSEILLSLYKTWKDDLAIESFSKFLDTVWKEKDKIKPKYLGENEYNNLRGIAFEEYCFDLLNKIVSELKLKDKIDIFWNSKIITGEFYVYEGNKFKKYHGTKNVDLVMGKRDDKSMHVMVFISCKIYQSSTWLSEERYIFDEIRNRYPGSAGFCLTMDVNATHDAVIRAQKTGLKIYDLSKSGNLGNFISDIQNYLKKQITQKKW